MSQKFKEGRVARSQPADLELVRAIAGCFPGAVEGISYGTPGFQVDGKLFARQHQDGEALVVKIEVDQ